MSNLEKVREALESLRRVAPVQSYEDEAEAARMELDAHEQEVRELVTIAKKFATGAVGHYDFDTLTDALRPFGDEK